MSRATSYSQAAKQAARQLQRGDLENSDLQVWNFYPAPRKWSTYIHIRHLSDGFIHFDEVDMNGTSTSDGEHIATRGIVQNTDTGECFTIGGETK